MGGFNRLVLGLGLLSATGFLALGFTAASQEGRAEHPGKAVYETYCGACHDNPAATRSPALEALKQMSRRTLTFALTEGKMKAQGQALSTEERAAVVDWLAAPEASEAGWIEPMMCPAGRRGVDLSAPATVTGFGFQAKGHRALTRAEAGLATADMGKLELAWAIGFPRATTMRSQPAVVGSTIFLPVAETSRVFAIDVAETPCIKWVYVSPVPLRTSAAYGEAAGRPVIAIGDATAHIHLIDAATGGGLWRKSVALFPLSLTTGTPAIHKGRVYAPVSQYEIVVGGNDNYECCKVHGGVVALDAVSGETVWKGHTMEDARPVRDRGDGRMLWGPSGAPIWTSPTIDEKRGVLYLGTGEANSEPADKSTDAILAFGLDDGKIRWTFQATENDIFLNACAMARGKPGLNCPKQSVTRDVDFGASVIIAKGKDGKDILLAGQKSGTVWALDPDDGGKLVWRQDFGEGSPLGGIHWGIAYDGRRVFAPINRPYGFRPGNPPGLQKPGLAAVDVATGEVAWTFAAQPDCTGDRARRTANGCAWNIGLSGAPTVIDGAVVEGSLDGRLRAFDAATGEVLFTYDTARDFATLNGVKARGGAIDNASIVATNGYLLMTSGYAMFGQMPGNVLVAFRARR